MTCQDRWWDYWWSFWIFTVNLTTKLKYTGLLVVKHSDTEKAITLQSKSPQPPCVCVCVCVCVCAHTRTHAHACVFAHTCVCVYPSVLEVSLPIHAHVPGKHHYIICNLVFRRHEKCTEHSIDKSNTFVAPYSHFLLVFGCKQNSIEV